MTAIRHLLAATDLSAPARHAAQRAALLARERGATLELLHIASTAPLDKLRRLVGELPGGVEDRVLDALRHDVLLLAEELHVRYGVAAGVRIANGAIPQEIHEAARKTGTDLVVLGARGASFMRHLLLGSTAERMVRKIRHPMLVVKQPPHDAYRRVLVPVDFSASSLPALRLARAVAPAAHIVLLHAFDVPFEGKLRLAGVDDGAIGHYRTAARQDALQKMARLADAAGLAPGEATPTVLHGDAWLRILEQEQEQDCDLIAMGKHGESMLEDMLLGSVTRHVLANAQSDILVSVAGG
ncbi:nucleotide-binding universal stress UspA family protein [Crenobacter luteus]|uniref:Universal stress protein n=1 Tax=Crenobacter luteus TaxID=1452487 RepID=A0A161SF11_9NEIS|nr:universal stress protein [Crenobacter luteus]KZE35173.1 universal stress protein [Crenobacter luteus]TCP12482.1 nucleotide-binding universal stress UspA family protein [Crenobacter luteus]